MENVRINHSKFKLKGGGYGAIAILMYSGTGDPKIALDSAVRKITADGVNYFELIDANLDNPWTRVVISGINEMKQEDLDPAKHLLSILKNAEY
jgi:hypothetical protein